MAAAVLAARRHARANGGTGTLAGGSEGQQSLHSLGGLSFDFATRTKSLAGEKESENKTNSFLNFPKKADIVDDLKLDVLVGRK
jgi:hypothetical protein